MADEARTARAVYIRGELGKDEFREALRDWSEGSQ